MHVSKHVISGLDSSDHLSDEILTARAANVSQAAIFVPLLTLIPDPQGRRVGHQHIRGVRDPLPDALHGGAPLQVEGGAGECDNWSAEI